MSGTQKDTILTLPVHTTVGELAAALYEEALVEFGDERIARRVASEALRDALARARRVRQHEDRAIEAA